jgi:phosphopantetheine--protein transferase-like protein
MNKVLGCGIDLEELYRFDKAMLTLKNITGFVRMVYSSDEIENNLNIQPQYTFPLCFSCKEAFFKALGVSWTNSPIGWKEIEVLFKDKDDLRNYSIRLSGYADELYRSKNCRRIDSDIECNNKYVIFQIVLLS